MPILAVTRPLPAAKGAIIHSPHSGYVIALSEGWLPQKRQMMPVSAIALWQIRGFCPLRVLRTLPPESHERKETIYSQGGENL